MNDRIRAVALGNDPADLLLQNGRVVDVLTEIIYDADVVIAEGKIAAIGPRGSYTKAHEVIDLAGAYIAPGLINAHCHVESSMASPMHYCCEELRWGTTTLITDPHEIANVAGAAGIRYMLREGRRMPLNYFVELPSCVPATPFEHAGCVMDAAAMAEVMHDEGVLGLGEMMNVPGVLYNDAEVLKKLALFQAENRVIDGHAPAVTGKELQAYVASGIDTDHESMNWSEAKEKLRAGLALLVREGSACHNLEPIIKGVLEEGIDVQNLAFCSDDKHLADIRREGSIRHNVRMAVALGMSPMRALRIASINAAKIYGLRHVGAIAPGYDADIVVFRDLADFEPLHVFYHGRDAWVEMEQIIVDFAAASGAAEAELTNSVHPAPFSEADFAVTKFVVGQEYPVIRMLPGDVFTERESIKGEDIPAALARGDVYLIAVLERHHGKGNIGLGLLSGYGLQNGAAATTVAHDSHNLMVIGTNARDMVVAARELMRVQGGYTLVYAGEVVGTVPLPICGLMSDANVDELIGSLERIAELAHAQGVPANIDPFISLSFMALPVIPKLKITDMGMFDVEKFKFC
ncbi:MAG: adenine deaminase [Phascolarctobacterium sp.]|nr:adenine deaminase [Phascolarctobacterium sp.]